MKTSRMLMVSLLLAPLFASAHNFQLQQRVAPVGVSDKGELNYADGNFSYQKLEQRAAQWKSASDTTYCRPQLRQRHERPTD
ncbi:Predicted transcriptional regulator [Serratia marcescens]|uniref:Predicted transcriptional regulator n=1 Tax=Serratia marcescens TaxID=615 RepID=A0A379Y397_SERMA|nr:Predicted transcriptional regulator [Serratia marcescens]